MTDELTVTRPKRRYYGEYLAACREARETGVKEWEPIAPGQETRWRKTAPLMYLCLRKGWRLPRGIPAMDTWWFVRDGKFVGECQIRKGLDAETARVLGHIGYAVRPALWGRGYGTEILKWAAEKARAMGENAVCLVIHEGNAASVRTAMKAGFCPAGNSTDPETGQRQDVYELK